MERREKKTPERFAHQVQVACYPFPREEQAQSLSQKVEMIVVRFPSALEDAQVTFAIVALWISF